MLKGTNVSRRGFLGTVAAAAAGGAGILLLQACGGAAPTESPPTQAPAVAAAATNTPAAAAVAQLTFTTAPAAAGPTATPAAQAQPSTKQTQFTYTARIGVQADHFDAFAKKFMAQYPNIKYVPQHIAGNEWLQKIQVEAAGGTLADAFWMPSIGLFGQFAHQGLLLPLDSFVQTQEFDLKVFYPAAVQGLTKEGKLYGIPWIVHPGRTGLYYNKPLFDAPASSTRTGPGPTRTSPPPPRS